MLKLCFCWETLFKKFPSFTNTCYSTIQQNLTFLSFSTPIFWKFIHTNEDSSIVSCVYKTDLSFTRRLAPNHQLSWSCLSLNVLSKIKLRMSLLQISVGRSPSSIFFNLFFYGRIIALQLPLFLNLVLPLKFTRWTFQVQLLEDFFHFGSLFCVIA